MRFEVGKKINWEGSAYEICFIRSRQVILWHLSTETLKPPLELAQLERAYLDNTLTSEEDVQSEKPMNGLLFSDLNELQQKTIIERMHFVNRVLVGDVTIHNIEKVILEVAKDIGRIKPISVGTVRRWLGIFRKSGDDPKSLVDHRYSLVR